MTLFVLGLVAPIVLLSPFVGAITQRVVFKRHPMVTTDPRVQTAVVRAWKPLDLGPDLVRWPSEAPVRTVPHFPEPAWPSEGWNDPHFGRKRQLPQPPSSSASASAATTARTKAAAPTAPPRPSPSFAPAQTDEVEPDTEVSTGTGSERLAGLDDRQVMALIDREGLVKAVEILVERGGFDAGTVAREIKRILGEVRARRR
ncbi:MAG: hypothetical protein H0V89_00145 [Deltaproteobacteria bacterium]|nr:hypothetical protein [Deltaproteobacteria bacterium]